MFAIGFVAALGASVLFNVGVALQALDAREAPPEQGLRLSLLARLLQRRRWLLGLVLTGAGFPLQVLAFAQAPFVVVQPALSAGLLLLLFLGTHLLGERVGRAEVLGVIAITGGIALIAWGAPDRVETHRGPGQVVLVVGALLAVSLLPFALRRTRLDTAMSVTIAAGVGFGTSNIASKLLSDNMESHHYANAAAWLIVTAAVGVAAVITEMTALQRGAATTVIPISFAIQTFLPIVLEPFFLREPLSSFDYDGAPLFAGMIVMFVGIVGVARTRSVSLLAAGGAK